MLNIEQITSSLARMPDQALQKYASMHKDDPYVMALAVSESNRRKQMREAAQGAQGAQPQPKVVDQDIAGMAPAAAPMPEEQGIARLPAGDMNFADGGIVAFAGGGQTAENPLSIGSAWRRWRESGLPLLPYLGLSTERPVQYYPESTIGGKGPSNKEIEQMLGLDSAGSAAAPAPLPGAQRPPTLGTAAPSPASASAPSTPAVGGIGDLRAQFEKSVAGMQPEGPKSVQEYQAERAAMLPKEKAYAGLEAALQKEEAAAPKEKDEALWMSMIQGGLAAAAGSSTNALKNIAEGFGVGASGYKESIKEFKKAEKDRQKAMADIAQARRAEERGDVDAAYAMQDRAQGRMDNYNKGLMSAYASLTGQEMGSRATIQAAQIHANATSAAANRPSADMQLIERVMAEKKIPFTQALQEVMGMKREPQSLEKYKAEWARDPYLQTKYPNVEDYLKMMQGSSVPGGGTGGFKYLGVSQ